MICSTELRNQERKPRSCLGFLCDISAAGAHWRMREDGWWLYGDIESMVDRRCSRVAKDSPTITSSWKSRNVTRRRDIYCGSVSRDEEMVAWNNRSRQWSNVSASPPARPAPPSNASQTSQLNFFPYTCTCINNASPTPKKCTVRYYRTDSYRRSAIITLVIAQDESIAMLHHAYMRGECPRRSMMHRCAISQPKSLLRT